MRFDLCVVLIACWVLSACVGQSMVKERYYDGIATALPLEAKYTALGASAVKTLAFSSGQKEFPNYKVWYPSDLEGSSKAYPLVIVVNGTGVTYPRFEPVFQHLASWGFIVAGNDDGWSALGISASKELEFLLTLSNDPGSPFYNKIDINNIGIAGHSQGGVGTIHAITDFSIGTRYRAMYTASAVSLSMIEAWKIDRSWGYDTSKIPIPYLMVAATGDIDANTISPLASLEHNFRQISGGQLTIMARRKGVDHGNTLDHADGYMTAWFRYLLLGDREAEKVFIGDLPEIIRNKANWQDVVIKGH